MSKRLDFSTRPFCVSSSILVELKLLPCLLVYYILPDVLLFLLDPPGGGTRFRIPK